MTSPSADSHASINATQNESEPIEASHPEPAFQEAQEWIEAVTGRSFGDMGFRSGLENGILLCELLSAIKPGLVKKINRLPTPIAGLDNLTVFLRGCEELGLNGSQLFDPGDLQDTSIRANLKDADCNRKLKNVLNTVFWLGKAANSCTSYSGPTLNLKEFEELLAQMRMGCEAMGDTGALTVRDSGYDCWDSERSESLSSPCHTRDNSLDSLDSFGSHSQQSPSPDVINRLNSDGRGSDSEAEGKKPDMRRDDMLARRTASSESRAPVPFNQFLPNRTNATAYVPAPRRRAHGEEGEQRSQHSPVLAEGDSMASSGPRSKPLKTVTWARGDSVNEVDEEPTQQGPDLTQGDQDCSQEDQECTQEDQECTQEDQDCTQEGRDVSREVLEQKRLQRLQKAGIKVLPAAVRYSRVQEPSEEEEGHKDRGPSPDIILRRDNDFLSNRKATWDASSSSDGEGEEEARRKVPDVRKDDLASRRAPRAALAPRVHQFLPAPVCSSRDRERWEGIRRASQQALQEKEPSERAAAVSDIITRKDNPFLNANPRAGEGEDEEDEEQGGMGGVKAVPNKVKDDLARRRALAKPRPHREGPMSFGSASMSQADKQKWERLRMAEPSDPGPAPVCGACQGSQVDGPPIGSAKAGRSRSKVVTFGGVTEIMQPREGEQSDMLRRLLAKATIAMPTIDLASRLREEERSQVNGSDPMLTPPPTPSDLRPWTPEATPTAAETDARFAQYAKAAQEEDEEEEEEERMPNLQKDDMLARRTGAFSRRAAPYNHFLPLPASKRGTQGEVQTDAAPRGRKAVRAEWERRADPRGSPVRELPQESIRVPVETPPQQRAPDQAIARPSPRSDDEEDEEEQEGVVLPDPEKDDMMARRTRAFNTQTAAGKKAPVNRFLPVPGSAVHRNVAPLLPVSNPPLQSRLKTAEKRNRDSRMAAESVEDPIIPPQKAPGRLPTRAGGEEEEREKEGEEKKERRRERDATLPNASAPLARQTATPPAGPPAGAPQGVGSPGGRQSSEGEAGVTEVEEVKRGAVEMRSNGGEPRGPQWMEEDDLPPMMMSRRVAYRSDDKESMSMGDMPTEEEAMGSVPPLNQSRFERTHETLHNFEEEDDGWQDNLARWKNRRRSASQELIKKEEERKRIEKRMKENGVESGKRKSIKTYKEIVEEKEKREIDLCESYRRAQTPEEAAMVLQRYALRFTISDATLDSLKLPRSTSPNTTPADPDQKDREPHPPPQSTHPPSETPEPPHLRPDPARMTEQHPTPQENEGEEGVPEARSSPTPPGSSTGHVGRPRPSLPPRPAPSELRPHQPPQGEPRGTPHTPPGTGEAQPGQTKGFRPQPAREDLESAKTVRVHHVSPTPYPPSKPVPLLTAKPYCLPGSSHSARKSVLLDGLVRVNGNVKEESKLSSTPASSTSTLMENPASSVSPPHSTEEKKEDTASFSPPQSPKQEKEEPASVSPPPSTEEKKEPAPSSTPLSSQEEKKEPVSSFSPPHSPKPAVQKPATFSPPQSPHKEKEVAASSFSPPQSPEQEKQDTVSSFSPPQSPEQDRQDTVSSFSPPLSPKREKEEPVPSFSPPLSPKQEKEEPVPSFSPPLSPKQEKEEPVPSFSPPLSPKREGEKPATFSPPLSPHKEKEDPASEQTAADSQRTASDQPTTESRGSHSGSAMSALIGGRNCIITTTIVTELTQTVVETIAMETDTDGSVNGTTERFDSSTEEREPAPAALPLPSSLPLTPLSPFTPLSPLSPLSSLSPISPLPTNGQMYSPTISEGIQESSSTIETPMLNLAKRVNHWVWDPNEERKRQERWQREQERLLQEQYQKEQEKLKGEWERAQKEVEEEERRHNEEERRILDETATPLNPSGLAKPPRPAPEEEGSRPAQPNHQTLGRAAHAEPHIQRPTTTNEDQHKSKLHFFQESSQDSEASRKHDLWKTSSLDRNTQLLQSNTVKRSGSDNTVAGSQQPPSSSSQPPSPSRCVSGKRLCSGCSQPLGKGAAMIIDTMGLFFHLPCFKCGVCSGQMGDTSTGTDVRIRNGHLTCNECYIATRGGGQPTTL
ncbi:serine/arginine repetitive matrix protein 2 isoform X1 [Gadus morhua]|uniref:serine/arginine repetitive matrix protein 2 isoform X1 n=1 Tax=Gadus morhua TaxID=8049 RepID=UPI0011B62C64|nr:serine/arginine repetitive matrix protein 2-like isoform X1 [Gadus morhua]